MIKSVIILVLLAGLGTLVSCGSKSEKDDKEKPKAKPYPVYALAAHKAEIYSDYPATIQGIQNIEIRPKIDGYIDAIYVDEGATVRKGELLFRINAPQYEQNVRNELANVKIAEANVNAARMQVNKIKPLVDKDIVSAYQLEAAQYTLQANLAALAQANATLKNAEINLSYTKIYSPSNGVIGILPYKIGSLVGSTTVNPLTTVSDIRSIYAYFSINERQGLDFFLSAKGNTLQDKLKTMPPVTLVLANGTTLAKKGIIQTASGLINAETGAINMRATFENHDGLVRSGSSAVVRIPQSINQALLVPQKSTYQIQGKLFVYVLGDSNKVKSAEIVVGSSTGSSYVVKSGVKKGEKIVVDGVSNLREGLVITPRMVSDSVVYQKF